MGLNNVGALLSLMGENEPDPTLVLIWLQRV